MGELQRLKGSQRVRQQVNVMFGNSDIRGSQQSLFEIGSNSIDRFKKGHGNKVIITKHSDMSYSVEDFAEGLPMAWNDKEKGFNWDLAIKMLYAGDNYKKDSEAIGSHGLGLCTSQFSAEFMKVISYRDGKKYIVNCKIGRPIDKDTNEFICDDDDPLFTKEQGERALRIEENNTDRTGTIIHYKPDINVFSEIDIPIEWIVDKFKKQAFVNKGLYIDIIDEINNKSYNLYYENGIEDYILEISNDKNLIDVVKFEDSGRGKDRQDKDEYNTRYEMVFTFNNEINELHHYHNSSELTQGGVTAKAIEKSFVDTIHEYISSNNLYTKDEKKVKFTDIEDSLICIISSFSNYTSYENQTKRSIDNEFIKEFVTDSLKTKLQVYFLENSFQANLICSTILNNMRARTKAEKTKLNLKKQLDDKNTSKDKIENFYDCVTTNPEEAEIYVAEGSSAQGSIIMGRNSNFQACIHVGGKMLSLLKADYEKIFKNKIVVQLFRKLGCGIEVRDKHNKELNCFDITKLKYHKIILATDSDTDAYNIRALILTCMYKLAPTLVEEGYVYIAESPLYEINDLKGNLITYVYTEQEKVEKLIELDSKDIKYSNPERNKGLGEVEPDIISETMMTPETRKITQVTVADTKLMAEKFELWQGDEVAPRREVIINNFDYVEYFEPISQKDITQVLDENCLPYAIEVIKERAIIGIDGFKASHRKLLWTLHEMNLYGRRSKSLNVVGSNTSYNIHGDGAIYQTLVRMGQKDTLLYTYVNGKGNFGQHTSRDLQEAHSRYTETGANEINKEFFKDINKNAVNFIPNFDGRKQEPTLLPTIFPNVLVNCNKGIAVGMASCTPSFNLNEVCDLTIEYINNKDLKVSDYLLSPDFATKGYSLIDTKILDNIYETGKGSIPLRGRYYVKNNSIFITEIPYTTTREVIIERINELCNTSVIKDITKVIDATDFKLGMCIQINIKKNCNVEKLMNILYSQTRLQDMYSFNMNIVCLDGIPRLMGIKAILDEWFRFRYSSIDRVIKFDKEKKLEQLHLLRGLEKVLLDIDKLIQLMKESKTDKESLSKVMEYFDIDELQGMAVINMKVYQINKENFIKRTANIGILEEEIIDLSSKENNIEYFNATIREQLEYSKKKYGKERMTEIISNKQIQEIEKSDLVEDYNPTIILTTKYIKKTRKYSDTQKLTEDDTVLQMIQCNNKDSLLLITNQGRLLIRNPYDLQDCLPSEFGTFMTTWLGEYLQEDEKVIYIHATKDWLENLICAFENGNVSKMSLIKSKPVQNRQVAIDKIYNTNSPLVSTTVSKQDIDILLVTQSGHGLIISTESINSVASKNGKGVGGIKLDIKNMIDDKVVGVLMNVNIDDSIILKTKKGKELYTVLNDISPDKNKSLFKYISGNRSSLGNFIYNTRQSKDKIIQFNINK